MGDGTRGPDHVRLVMIKAMRALTRYAAAGIEDTGQGDSDFRVLEVLLHRGPHHHQTRSVEVNTIATNSGWHLGASDAKPTPPRRRPSATNSMRLGAGNSLWITRMGIPAK